MKTVLWMVRPETVLRTSKRFSLVPRGVSLFVPKLKKKTENERHTGKGVRTTRVGILLCTESFTRTSDSIHIT